MSAFGAARADRRFGRMVMASILVHVGTLLAFVVAGALTKRMAPQPQTILTTTLVRLGPKRQENLLPRLSRSAPQKPQAVPALQKPPQAKAPPAPTTPAQPSAQTSSALTRLKQSLAGRDEGAVDGETDEPQIGDQYGAEIKRCLQSHYVIEGSDRAQVASLKALVLLRIQADGRIIDHRVLQSSGNLAFDQAVSRAVRGCGQVSPPPPSSRRWLRDEGIQIDFSP